ncbi:MAG: hypothetical protein WCI40_02140 [Verrucomicrobiota bacterium]
MLGNGEMLGIAEGDGIGVIVGTGVMLGVIWVGVTFEGVESAVSLERLHPETKRTEAALRQR